MKILFFIICILLLLPSCKKPDYSKIKGLEWNPNLATPIGDSEFGVKDILDGKGQSDFIAANAQGEIAVNYSSEIGSISADQLAKLDDQKAQIFLSPSEQGIAAIPVYSVTLTHTVSKNISLSLSNGLQLKEILLHSGQLKLDFSTELKHDVRVKLIFPDIVKNAVPLSCELNSSYIGNSPHGAMDHLDLSGALLALTAGGTALNNTLRATITITVVGKGGNISGNEKMSINIGLNNLKLDRANGYFGQQALISKSDSLQLNLFDKTFGGFVQLTNPKLRFKVTNGFGIPVKLNITGLKSINANTGAITNLNSSVLNDLLIPAATSPSSPSVIFLPELNKANTTNMDKLVNNTPKYFSYNVSAMANPGGVVSDNFVSKDSKIQVAAELELPLEGYAYDFALRDTINFNFSQDADLVESVMFRLYSENGFPISFKTGITFIDANSKVLFTVLTDGTDVIKAAPVDDKGKVIQNASHTLDITVKGSQVALLKNAKNVIITGVAATTQPQSTVVKIHENYKLYMKLSMQAKLKVKLDL